VTALTTAICSGFFGLTFGTVPLMLGAPDWLAAMVAALGWLWGALEALLEVGES